MHDHVECSVSEFLQDCNPDFIES
jgi:hypothetical protein